MVVKSRGIPSPQNDLNSGLGIIGSFAQNGTIVYLPIIVDFYAKGIDLNHTQNTDASISIASMYGISRFTIKINHPCSSQYTSGPMAPPGFNCFPKQ